ncbi:MAG: WecB/TagA/CpsF family glycosyltransferase [Opitutales bacterium]
MKSLCNTESGKSDLDPNSDADRCQVLGVSFFNGALDKAIKQCGRGGLVVIPSGPGLACDLPMDEAYRRALREADLVLPDSGLMSLFWICFRFERIRRVSGYAFLKELLEIEEIKGEGSFWIMPDADQGEANCLWLGQFMGIDVDEEDLYEAPLYSKRGPLIDEELLERLRVRRPRWIFVNLGGGVQERLGLYLRETLNYNPTIVCSGAALAFLSGQQVGIPMWADRFFLGWLFRCFAAPRRFVPRYWRAWKLVWLLARYGRQCPRAGT